MYFLFRTVLILGLAFSACRKRGFSEDSATSSDPGTAAAANAAADPLPGRVLDLPSYNYVNGSEDGQYAQRAGGGIDNNREAYVAQVGRIADRFLAEKGLPVVVRETYRGPAAQAKWIIRDMSGDVQLRSPSDPTKVVTLNFRVVLPEGMQGYEERPPPREEGAPVWRPRYPYGEFFDELVRRYVSRADFEIEKARAQLVREGILPADLAARYEVAATERARVEGVARTQAEASRAAAEVLQRAAVEELALRSTLESGRLPERWQTAFPEIREVVDRFDPAFRAYFDQRFGAEYIRRVTRAKNSGATGSRPSSPAPGVSEAAVAGLDPRAVSTASEVTVLIGDLERTANDFWRENTAESKVKETQIRSVLEALRVVLRTRGR